MKSILVNILDELNAGNFVHKGNPNIPSKSMQGKISRRVLNTGLHIIRYSQVYEYIKEYYTQSPMVGSYTVDAKKYFDLLKDKRRSSGIVMIHNDETIVIVKTGTKSTPSIVAQLTELVDTGNIQNPTPDLLSILDFDNGFNAVKKMQDNATKEEMKMLLSRIGKNCKMIFSGDESQSDLGADSGLLDAVNRLQGIEGIEVVNFMDEDIVRSKMCKQIIMAYRD